MIRTQSVLEPYRSVKDLAWQTIVPLKTFK